SPRLAARSLAASTTGSSTSKPIAWAAPCLSTRCSVMPPEPQPTSRIVLSASDRPSSTRSTSSGPPGDRYPSPHSASRKRMASSSYSGAAFAVSIIDRFPNARPIGPLTSPQSLTQPAQIATMFVEHSFNMAGQIWIPHGRFFACPAIRRRQMRANVKTWDAIVVGGGHNGLVNACYLQRAGLDVLVVEKNEWVGGAATSRELAPGFLYSNCSYVCSL